MKKLTVSLVIIILSFVFYKTVSFLNFIYSKASISSEEIIFNVDPGSSFSLVSTNLFKLGLIKNKDYFMLLARLQNAFSKIKVGEFKFTKDMTPLEVMDKLIKGKVTTYAFTIPEGYNLYQIAQVLLDLGLIESKNVFIQAAKDKSFAQSLEIPADTVEGYLYPDTYNISKKMPVREIIKLMVKNLNNIFTSELEERARQIRFTKHQVITLASIVEKETGAAFERPLISSVFHNRLNSKMRLQSDPTTIYGIWESFNGNLTKSDLQSYSPYNTYYIFGLPPAPIANPGKAAIMAALYPQKSEYLFFVSKNDGTHFFSSNYREHSRAVHDFQKTKKNRVGKSWRELNKD